MITFKSKEDFEKMSKAGKAVKNIHEQIHNHAKEGVSLKELDSLAKKVIEGSGCKSNTGVTLHIYVHHRMMLLFMEYPPTIG